MNTANIFTPTVQMGSGAAAASQIMDSMVVYAEGSVLLTPPLLLPS